MPPCAPRKRRNGCLAIVGFVLLATAPAPAEAARGRSSPGTAAQQGMEAAIRAAARRHPAIAEATAVMLQQQQEIAMAKSGYLPKISGGVASAHSAAGAQNWRPALNLTASQLLYDFGKVASEVDAASAETEARQARIAVTTDDIARETAFAYIESQRYQALLAVATRQIADVRAIGALVDQRSHQGASAMSDRELAEARILGAEASRLEIEGEHKRWLGKLSLLGGVNLDAVSPRVPVWLGKSCANARLDWSRIPAAAHAEARRRKAIADLDNSRAQLFPTLSLSASADYDPFFERPSGPAAGRLPDQRRFNYTAGIRLTGNLYEGGATLARRRAANHALTAAMAAGAAIRLETRQKLAQARNIARAVAAQQRAVKLRDAALVKTRDLYRQQYVELGTRTLLDLLNGEQELYASRFQNVNLSHDQRQQQIACLYATGQMRQAFAIISGTVQ